MKNTLFYNILDFCPKYCITICGGKCKQSMNKAQDSAMEEIKRVAVGCVEKPSQEVTAKREQSFGFFRRRKWKSRNARTKKEVIQPAEFTVTQCLVPLGWRVVPGDLPDPPFWQDGRCTGIKVAETKRLLSTLRSKNPPSNLRSVGSTANDLGGDQE